MKGERGKKLMGNGKWKAVFLAAVVLITACATGEGVESHEAWARSALQGENSAIYLVLHNHTDIDDALVDVSTDAAEAAELHLTEVQNDVMTMTPQERIEIPAEGEVIFETGGYHIMLIGLKQNLNISDEISITLHFENYPDVVVNVPVRESAGAEEHNHP